MALKGQVTIRSQVTDNEMLEQENTFTRLRCKISYEEEKHKTLKINKYIFTNVGNSECFETKLNTNRIPTESVFLSPYFYMSVESGH
jgi:hypothetical protein